MDRSPEPNRIPTTFSSPSFSSPALQVSGSSYSGFRFIPIFSPLKFIVFSFLFTVVNDQLMFYSSTEDFSSGWVTVWFIIKLMKDPQNFYLSFMSCIKSIIFFFNPV